MPKIIANIREQLLDEAKRQIQENGYAKTTIRSVASACSVGVGTVYNYFPSKDMLIASFMLEEWQDCLQAMHSHPTNNALVYLEGIYYELRTYIDKHHSLFSDTDASKVFASAFAGRHKLLRDQLAEVILPICNPSEKIVPRFLAEYIAESLLTWTVAGKSYNDLSPILKLLLCNNI